MLILRIFTSSKFNPTDSEKEGIKCAPAFKNNKTWLSESLQNLINFLQLYLLMYNHYFLLVNLFLFLHPIQMSDTYFYIYQMIPSCSDVEMASRVTPPGSHPGSRGIIIQAPVGPGVTSSYKQILWLLCPEPDPQESRSRICNVWSRILSAQSSFSYQICQIIRRKFCFH